MKASSIGVKGNDEDVGTLSGVAVRVAVGVTDAAPDVGVRVSVEVGVLVAVGVADPPPDVGVRVGVDMATLVAVGALELNVINSCGRLLPSREENLISSLLSPASTKL